MKSSTGTTSKLIRLLFLVLFLTLVPTALAGNTWYVDGVNGNDNNDCKSPQTACKTIGRAIALCSSGDTIRVAPATYTENLTISISLKVIGSGAKTTIVDGGSVGTVFTISSTTANVTLSKLTIRNGRASSGGGGVQNNGTLTVKDSTISSNYGDDAGGINNWVGASLAVNRVTIIGNSSTAAGGISNLGALMTINNSTISGNSSPVRAGGIYNQAPAAINNSTITGNWVKPGDWGAGGIWNDLATLTLNNVTITSNSAYNDDFNAGGIYNYSYTVALQNSIVADNTGGNCGGRALTSNGYNLSSDKTCSFTGPGDRNKTKPKLGKLRYNGGPTQTIRLLRGSPAIDAGNPNGCTDDKGNLLKTDQRGKPRPDREDKTGCDMGAFEKQSD
jgi:hypothetical protein